MLVCDNLCMTQYCRYVPNYHVTDQRATAVNLDSALPETEAWHLFSTHLRRAYLWEAEKTWQVV